MPNFYAKTETENSVTEKNPFGRHISPDSEPQCIAKFYLSNWDLALRETVNQETYLCVLTDFLDHVLVYLTRTPLKILERPRNTMTRNVFLQQGQCTKDEI